MTNKKISFLSKYRWLVILLLVITLVIFSIVPPILLETDLQSFDDSQEKKFAWNALRITDQTLSNPLERLVIISYGITIEKENGEPKTAKVVAYTIFGIQYAVVEADYDGASVKKRIID